MGGDLVHHRAANRAGHVGGRGDLAGETHLVPITRDGKLEEVYWTYSYGPIDDTTAPNGVGGVLVVCAETTEHVDRAGRRLGVERERRAADAPADAPVSPPCFPAPSIATSMSTTSSREIAGDRDFIGRTGARSVSRHRRGAGFLRASGPRLRDRRGVVAPRPGDAGQASISRWESEYLDFLYQPVRDDFGPGHGDLCRGKDKTKNITESAVGPRPNSRRPPSVCNSRRRTRKSGFGTSRSDQ